MKPDDEDLAAEDAEFLAAMADGSAAEPAVDGLVARATERRSAREHAEFLAYLASHPPTPKEADRKPENQSPRRSNYLSRERMQRRIAKFEWSPEAQIDLHNRNLTGALAELERFAAWARGERLGNFLVITGHGRHSDGGEPILAPAVRRWLDHRRLDYLPAPPRLGGSGALVVLLPQPDHRC